VSPRRFIVCLAVSLAALVPSAQALTLRVASAFDPQTMDPQALALLYHSRIAFQVYESLVTRDEQFRIEPGLALSWQMTSPTSWRLQAAPERRLPRRHALSAPDDAVFSLDARDGPDLAARLPPQRRDGGEEDRCADGRAAARAARRGAAEKMQFVAMMSKAWCETHGVAKAQDFNGKQETYAVRNANGTGPFKLVALRARRGHGARAPRRLVGLGRQGTATSTRCASRPSSRTPRAWPHSPRAEVDLVLDPPFQDVERLKREPRIALLQIADLGPAVPGLRPVHDELEGSDIKGRNPSRTCACARRSIRRSTSSSFVQKVLRGLAVPTGGFLSTRVDGSLPELDHACRYDPARAKALLAEAGYRTAFSITLDCVNVAWREAVCQAGPRRC